MSARFQTLIRLLAVQASWTYERMAGIGVGHASAPLLREVYAGRSTIERKLAIARSADFFNSHPYLAGVAVGAVVRAEADRVPGPVITRLRMALSGPLGGLGDQLIWAGWVPALVAVALITAPWFGVYAIAVVVLLHNLLRMAITAWGLGIGLREGLGVGAALQRSWLPRAAAVAQQAAALMVGIAIPVVAWQVLAHAGHRHVAVTATLALLGTVLAVAPATRAEVSGLRYGLALMAVAAVLTGVTR
jgi:PTS system mannose-specific IID component